MNNLLNAIFSFLILVLLEFIIIKLFTKKRVLYTLGICILINLFTWPFANLIFSFFINLVSLILVEIGVIIIESAFVMIFFKIKYKKAFFISFLANFITAFFMIPIFSSLFTR